MYLSESILTLRVSYDGEGWKETRPETETHHDAGDPNAELCPLRPALPTDPPEAQIVPGFVLLPITAWY